MVLPDGAIATGVLASVWLQLRFAWSRPMVIGSGRRPSPRGA